ncbi:MAG TPA: PAS domain-containing protein, partial [Gemmatimonadaceae bacterium]|nr:PAS domain-containing protein [Gemmatimonadaceae bacterium]
MRGSIQQSPLPFALTRGPEHNLVYVNSAFGRLTGVSIGDSLGAPIATAFAGTVGPALSAILDGTLRDGVESLDQRVEGGTAWLCSVWPVIADKGSVEVLAIEIRVSTPSDAELELQQKVAEQMLLGALRERGLA